ncbi:uncharacterized protein LOC126735176 [Anthonomus grandis grandis]|uniref:uncharacterized protein LOC126735176 n=1 Tax=Anthonomus grandis grandis TaxID=2921223 RepID=UPI0021660F5F|nr:uncharacterized protein LOC126735176 [Anthonomus grandis grandis]
MVRTYKKTLSHFRNGKNYVPYRHYSEKALARAIEEVKKGRLTLAKASEHFKVPIATISRRARGSNIFEKPGRPSIFSKEEEEQFVKYLNIVAAWGFPFDILDLRLFVKNYLDKKGVQEVRLKDNFPGRDWALAFLKRHEKLISNRLSSNISTKRASLSPEAIDNFFDNARDNLLAVNPSLMINYDETNLTDNPGTKKYIYKRGSRYPERVINSTKTAISLMYAGTADGQILPVYVVYKGEHLWDSWTEGGPKGARYNRSKSGWFDSACFRNWFFTVALIGDNLSSHFSEDVLKTCEKMDIAFICLPSNATHVMQPLDVAFYSPLKKYWREILTTWKKGQGRKMTTLSKDVFPRLRAQLHNKIKENGKGRQNLISGFAKTGLHPLNPAQPKERLPASSTTERFVSITHFHIPYIGIFDHPSTPTDNTIASEEGNRLTSAGDLLLARGYRLITQLHEVPRKPNDTVPTKRSTE